MNRFRKAWLALTGRLEPQEVVARSELVKAYRVTDWTYHVGGGMVSRYPKARRFYASCAQAYAQEPRRTVEEVDLIRVGGANYFLPANCVLREVRIEPKPKREKGKRAK